LTYEFVANHEAGHGAGGVGLDSVGHREVADIKLKINENEKYFLFLFCVLFILISIFWL
jgi:hypothetical protein